MNNRSLGIVIAATFASVFGSAATVAEAVGVVGASPQGEVSQVRQVAVKFSEAVVPFGDPRLPDPFAVACQGAAPAGSGRWVNDRAWVYDFQEAVPPGTRCTVKLRAEWKPSTKAAGPSSGPAEAASGAATTLTGPTQFAFSTGGPAVISMQPGAGSEIEEDQHFMLRLNGPAVEATVAANAWCEVEGIGERLPLRIVGGDLRAQMLKARSIDPRQAALILFARCERPLPNGAALRVIWGKGIAAAANPQVLTTIEQRFRFKVRAAFTADFSCEREKAGAPCLPIRPMTVGFSAAVPRELAAQVRLKPASGEALAPVFDKDDKEAELTSLKFPKPLPENTVFTVVMPAGMKDVAGRVLANASSFPLKVSTGDAPPIAKFAAAPFGIVERYGDKAADKTADGAAAMLPVTLRHVQGELRPSAANGAGQLRIKRLQTDSDILAWYALVRKYHETTLTAKELGFPESQWYDYEDETTTRGRLVKRRFDRQVATREVSLLAKDNNSSKVTLPQLEGGDPRPFEVVGIPLKEPGYHVVEIESLRLGQSLLDKRAPMFVRTGVLVTNLGVHFKQGRENSVVWVTSLDKGKPVEGADVAVSDCNGKTLWNGRTDATGLAVMARGIDEPPRQCIADGGLFVTARKAEAGSARDKAGATDVAFVFSSWQKGIEPWRFNVATGRGRVPDIRASTVFDRTLFRAGETVSMKHFVRMETSQGLAAVPADRLPNRARIVHDGSGQEFVFPLQWSVGGRSATTVWPIPPAAKLGSYSVTLQRTEPKPGAAAGRRWPPAKSKPAMKTRTAARCRAGRAATSGSRSSACPWSTRG